jgi:hypothetical protein
VGDASHSGLSFADVVAAENTFAQFVFEVRVRPGSFTVQGNTIGSWPKRGKYHGPSPKTTFMQYDETCHSDLLEWLVLDPKDVVCTGVMIRQLPHGLMDASLNRERYMGQLTGWDEAAGSQRPRTWGKGCAGELPNGVAWEWNNEPSNGQTLSYADGLRWERYAPDIIPRLSRDYPEIIPRSADGLRWERYAPDTLPRSPTTPEQHAGAHHGARSLPHRYAPEVSAIIEAAYLAYQRFVFLGQPPGAPGPYAIHFGTEWRSDATHGPEQRRADGDKKQDWRRRTIRRVAL